MKGLDNPFIAEGEYEGVIEHYTRDQLEELFEKIDARQFLVRDYIKGGTMCQEMLEAFRSVDQQVFLLEYILNAIYPDFYVELRDVFTKSRMSPEKLKTSYLPIVQCILNPMIYMMKYPLWHLMLDKDSSLIDLLFHYGLHENYYNILFHLLVEFPKFIEKIEQRKFLSLIYKAFKTKNYSLVSLLVNEGFLHRLSPRKINKIKKKASKKKYPLALRSKIDNWHKWYVKGYFKFRKHYIVKEDVLVLQRIERMFNRKMVYCPKIIYVLPADAFSINERRHVDMVRFLRRDQEIPEYLKEIEKKLPHLVKTDLNFKDEIAYKTLKPLL